MELMRNCQESSTFDPDARAQEQADGYNASTGTLDVEDGISCEACGNKGFIAIVRDRAMILCDCKCKEKRKTKRILSKSGLADLVGRYRLDNFTADSPWHRHMRDTAVEYLASFPTGRWMFAGGQVGCGKTHICTAICGRLIDEGYRVRYMVWREESTRLKALVNHAEEYGQMIRPFLDADVLYIDDLFKIKRSGNDGGYSSPTAGDINLAFEILNHRYNDSRKATIISSEWLLQDVMAFDGAVGSRIYERSKGAQVNIVPASEKNYRIHGNAV